MKLLEPTLHRLPLHRLPLHRSWTQKVLAAALIAITLLVFSSVRHFEFVAFDDDLNVYQNPHLRSPELSGISFFWSNPYYSLYTPLTYTVWAVLASVARLPAPASTLGMGQYDLDPAVFHLANLGLHIANVLLVWRILTLLLERGSGEKPNDQDERQTRADNGKSERAAAAGALLFGLHPLQVEPVAWVTGFNNVLSGVFALLALWAYLLFALRQEKEVRDGAQPHDVAASTPETNETTSKIGRFVDSLDVRLLYAVATGSFVLALLSKPTVVALPLVAWALDRWWLERSLRQSAAALWPWLGLGAICALVTKAVQPIEVTAGESSPLWMRPLIAGDALAFYLGKLFWPLRLTIDYGRSPDAIQAHWWGYATWTVPAIVAVALWRLPAGTTKNALAASASVFVAALLPMLGWLPSYFTPVSTVADRYLYLAMLGPALLLAWTLRRNVQLDRNTRKKSAPPMPTTSTAWLACALVLAVLGALSHAQVRMWDNTETLFRHALQTRPQSWLAHNNLGLLRARHSNWLDATSHFENAVRLKPDYLLGQVNLAKIYERTGDQTKAINAYRRALKIAPGLPEANTNLALLLEGQGQYEEAALRLQSVTRIIPDNPIAHFNLAQVLEKQGKFAEAIRSYRRGLALDSGYPKAQTALLALQKRTPRANGTSTNATGTNATSTKRPSFRP